MKKNLNKLATLALTGMMVAGMSFGSLAAAEIGAEGAVSSVNGVDNTLTLKKKMKIVDVDDNTYSDQVSAPGITYTYTVTAAGQDEMGTAENGVTRLPGLGTIADATVTFTTSQHAEKGILSGDLNLNFSSLLSAEGVKPGIYRYKLTEGDYASTDNNFTYTNAELVENTSKTRFVDVYVGYAKETDSGELDYSALKILGYVVSYTEGTNKTTGYEVKEDGDGVNGFGTVYKTFDVKVKKTVAGAFGNKKGQYEFGASVPMPSGASYGYVFNTDSDSDVTSKTEDLALGSVKLNDEQYFTIKGVPAGHTVTVEEKDYSDNGYKTSVTGATKNDSTGKYEAAVDGVENKATEVVFTNTKTDVPVTGIVVDVAPYAAMILGAGAFAGIFLGKKKSENED